MTTSEPAPARSLLLLRRRAMLKDHSLRRQHPSAEDRLSNTTETT